MPTPAALTATVWLPPSPTNHDVGAIRDTESHAGTIFPAIVNVENTNACHQYPPIIRAYVGGGWRLRTLQTLKRRLGAYV